MSVPAHTVPLGVISLWLFIAIVTGAAYTLRVLKRRDRSRARLEVAGLAQSLREFLAGRLERGALAEIAGATDEGTFWTVLEGLAPRGDEWLALSRALARCIHLEAERFALLDDSPWRRELAARRLGLLFTPASRQALRDALRSGPELVTVTAALALARFRDLDALRWLLENPQALARRTPRSRLALLRAFGRRALPLLAGSLERGTRDPALDRALIEALGLAGHDEARFLIERRLREGDVEQRVAAARALGRLAAGDCATTLSHALQDEAWQVRAQAAWALGRTRAPIALLALPARLTDPVWWVRHHAAYALRELGQDGRRELERLAHGSPDPYARDMAREALEGWTTAA